MFCKEMLIQRSRKESPVSVPEVLVISRRTGEQFSAACVYAQAAFFLTLTLHSISDNRSTGYKKHLAPPHSNHCEIGQICLFTLERLATKIAFISNTDYGNPSLHDCK